VKRKREPNSVAVLLRLPAFRRLWAAIAVSSLGDWLGLLATTALAAYLTKDSSNLAQGAAVSGVLLTRLLPDLILGPVAGALVDRFDRRKVAIVGDTMAGLLYVSIIFSGNLLWLLVAQFLVEAIGLFSTPAKQAMWVNVVPRERLAVANQLNYVSVYGMVPVAAVLFALLSTVATFFGVPVVAGGSGALISGGTNTLAIDIALAIDAGTYFFSAFMVLISRGLIPAFVGDRSTSRSIFSLIAEGVSFVRKNRLMRSIYVGILGAFGAGGLVAGVAQAYVATLGAGNAGYGILFGAVFTGLALGMLIGPKVLPNVPRRMIFTPAIGAAGIALIVMSVLQDFLGAAITASTMGVFAGIAWINGFTMIGHEVSDQLRGRVFHRKMPPALWEEPSEHAGALIAVEGADAAAAADYLKGIEHHLREAGYVTTVVRRRELPAVVAAPGADPLADALRSSASLADLMRTRVGPALEGGEVVLCDGFMDELIVRYRALGLDEVQLSRVAQWAVGGLKPDLTLVVDAVPAAAADAAAGPEVTSAEVDDPVPPATGGVVPPEPAPADEDNERVDPAQAYRDRVSYTPERYLIVRPLSEEHGRINAEVTERIASVLRERSPATIDEQKVA
jgi:dTMP kinase